MNLTNSVSVSTLTCVVLTLLLSTVLSTGTLYAGQRVLFAFDGTGVHIHRVVNTQVDASDMHFPANEESGIQARSVAVAKQALKEGIVLMIWQDENLQTLATTNAPDPRITHPPFDGGGVDATRVAVLTGGWMADAPADAAHVLVLFPEIQSLGLPEQQWPLWLDDAND